MLSCLGYEVQLASDGLETIELYGKAKGAGRPFDCVLMDLTIPGAMGGKEAIQKLLEIDPNVTVIVSYQCKVKEVTFAESDPGRSPKRSQAEPSVAEEICQGRQGIILSMLLV